MKIVIKNVIQFDIIRKFHEISRKNYFLLEIIRYFKLSNSRQYLKYTNSLFLCSENIYSCTHNQKCLLILLSPKRVIKNIYIALLLLYLSKHRFTKKNCTHLLELVHNVISSFKKILFCIIKYSQYLLWCN